MPVEIRNSNKYGPATEKDLADFEKQLKAKLPEDYRVFLLEHNGGEPNPEIFLINESQGDDILAILYSLGKAPTFTNLGWNHKSNVGYLPANMIAIGADPGGNKVCLSLSGPDAGSIYFWDHEGITQHGRPNYDNLYLLAPNFTAFMDGLTPNIDDEDEE